MSNNKIPKLEDLRKQNGAENLTEEPIKTTGPILDEDDDVVVENAPAQNPTAESYTGPGVIVDKLPTPEDGTRRVGPLEDKERREDIQRTLREMDEEIMEQHRQFIEMTKGGKLTPPLPEGAVRNPNVSTEEITVLIDKTGAGNFNFTPEEQARIDRADRIKLVEVTNKELQNVKIKKKFDRSKHSAYVKKTFNRTLAPVLALASNYTAKMRNIPAIEALQIMQRPGKDSVKSMLEKWGILYDKITDVSGGDFKDFDDFLKYTAYCDYNNFIYAILCSSYPESDSVGFTCTQEGCEKPFRVEYKNNELIRKDTITPECADVMRALIDMTSNSDTKTCRENMEKYSALSNVYRFLVDETSGILVDIYIPSVREQADNIIPYITEEMTNNDLMQRVVVLAHNIQRILLPGDEDVPKQDTFNENDYIEASDFNDVVYLLSQFNEYQLELIENRINNMLSPYMLQYGLEKVVCPYCKHNYGAYPMGLDALLFQRVRQRMRTEIV